MSQDTKIDPEEIACLDLDPQREAEVAAWLRQQEDVAKFEFVWRVLRRNAGLGFALAKKDPRAMEDLRVVASSVRDTVPELPINS